MKVKIRTKVLKDGTQSLYLDIYHRGKRRYEFLNLYLTKNKLENIETKRLAEEIRAKRQIELANQEFDSTPMFKKNINFISYFEDSIRTKDKYSIYYSTLKQLKKFAGNKITFQEINEKFLDNFKEFLLSNVSQNTSKEYLSVLKRILKKAHKEKFTNLNIAEIIPQIKSVDIKRDFLTIKEVEQLAKSDYKFSFPDIKRAFLFSCFTGLRFSDVKALRWSDVKGDYIEIQQKKTKQFLFIPLSVTAETILKNRVESIISLKENYVFRLPKRAHTNVLLKKWFKDVGIEKNAHFHLSRHTFAVMNITQGANIYTVSKLLGHRDLKTTEIYSKLIDEKKIEAINNLPIIEVKI